MSRLQERIENFNKAFDLYEQAHNAYCSDKGNKIYHLAMIQSFEIVFELGWKCLKDFLLSQGISAYTPREIIKEAFAVNILPQAQIWIDMMGDRNLSSHESNEDRVLLIIEKIGSVYFEELLRFQKWLEEICE